MVILGLGSNMGNRRQYLAAAVARLSGLCGRLALSRVFESAALLPPGAPEDWNRPFLNMAVSGTAALPPGELLAGIKQVERDVGRQDRGVWGPREIDIDILAMDDVVSQGGGLNIPHRELLNRDFALVPLVDVAPRWRYPVEGEYYGWLACDIAAARGFTPGAALTDAGRLDDAA